jgi:LCP family protein required for cell wall assembly
MTPRHSRGRTPRSGRPLPIRRWPRRVLISTNVLVALALLGTATAFAYVQFQFHQIKRVAVPGLAQQGSTAPGSQSKSVGSSVAPFTMLVIGSDTRDLGSGGSASFGSAATDPGQRSDSIILVRFIPATRSVALLSIPRDTLVDVPGYGTTRINVAFNNGPTLLVKVLAQDFGIQVNHVAQFNFSTFEDIANAIGGVYQWFPGPAKDINSNLVVPQGGCVLLTGGQALAFARSREYEYSTDGGNTYHFQLYPESDLGRIQRQQDFVKLAAAKIKAVAPTNPLALNALITSLTKDVTLDSSFSDSLIISLARDYRSADLSTIPSFTYPTMNSTEVPGALDPDTALGTQEINQWLAAGRTTAAPSTTTTTTTAPAPATTTPPTTTVAPSSVSVEVVNGSGVSGQAGQATSDLSGLGYDAHVDEVGDFGHATTVIDYAPDSRAAAKQLQSQLKGGATLTEDSALTPTTYNLELITGQDFTGVTATSSGSGATGSGSTGSGATTTTVPSTTTTTIAPETSPAYVGTPNVEPDSSSYYHGRYIPPGREPGQIPATCPL